MSDEWSSFLADVESALNGHLDMEVLNSMWTLNHCTLYHVDHYNRLKLFMYVKRKGELCSSCNNGCSWSQCGNCTKIKVKHGSDYVPIKVFVRKVSNTRTCSGWIDGNNALCLRQVMNYFKSSSDPNRINTLGTGFPPFVGATRDIFPCV